MFVLYTGSHVERMTFLDVDRRDAGASGCLVPIDLLKDVALQYCLIANLQ